MANELEEIFSRYTLYYNCGNCGHSGPHTFEHGQPAPEAVKCSHCGVFGAHKTLSRPDLPRHRTPLMDSSQIMTLEVKR